MDVRKRRLAFVLVASGLSLAAFGVYRWPPATFHGGDGVKGKKDVPFRVDRNRYDVYAGLADYAASSALLALALWLLLRRAPKGHRWADIAVGTWQGQAAVRTLICLAIFCTLMISLLTLYAILAVIGIA